MTPAFTVLLPHKRNPGNDAALRIALDCLYTNTKNDFILISDAAYDSPLCPRVNAMVAQATTDILVYTASDMFFAPQWDVPMLEAYDEHTFVTNVVVEPGAIAMHHLNLHKDFGRKPETFNRASFEQWAGSSEAHFPNGEGWYAPYMFPRAGFLAMGGLDTTLTAPDGFTAADTVLFDKWKAAGNKVVRARSYCYHLQRYSDIGEQEHSKRQ